MRKTEEFNQISPGIYPVGGKNATVAPFLSLLSLQSTQGWFDILDHSLLMMVNAQNHTEMDAAPFTEMYWQVRTLRDAFKTCVAESLPTTEGAV